MPFILIALLIWGFSPKLKAQNQAQAETINILTWNVQLLPRHFAWATRHLRKKQALRLKQISQYFQAQDYEVIALQEVFAPSLRRRLQKQLRQAYPHQVFLKGRGLRYSSGLLLLSRFPVRKLGHVYFKQSKAADRTASKAALLVELDLGQDKRLQILNTHLQSEQGPAYRNIRQSQMQALAQLAQTHANKTSPQILLGDFNIAEAEQELFEQNLPSFQIHKAPDGPFCTFCPDNTWNPPHTIPQQLDYILYAPPTLKLSPLQKHRLVFQHRGQTMDASDHYGLKTTLHY